ISVCLRALCESTHSATSARGRPASAGSLHVVIQPTGPWTQVAIESLRCQEMRDGGLQPRVY
ncbi:MAG: hypothetical protein ACRD06_06265, partial [Terriglobia bacterium]